MTSIPQLTLIALLLSLALAASAQTSESTNVKQDASAIPAEQKPRVNRVFTRITGIDDKAVRVALLKAVELRGLKRRADATDAQIKRLFQKAPRQLATALEPFGYYQAKIRPDLSFADGKYNAVFDIALGPQAKIVAVDYQMLGAASTDESVAKAWRKHGLQADTLLSHPRYELAKTEIQRALVSRGYLDAELIEHRVDVTRANATAAVKLHWQSGVRYQLGSVQFSGMQFSDAFMQRYVGFNAGDNYTQKRLLDLQQRLTDADYFSLIDIEPNVEAAANGMVPITVEVAPAKRSIYTYGLSFGTDSGLGVRGGLERRWVNHRGHKLRAAAEASQRLNAAALSYELPLPDKNRSSYALNLSYRDQETESSRAKIGKIGLAYTREYKNWQQTLALQAIRGDFDVGGEAGKSTLIYPEVILYKREADDFLYPREGYSINLNARAGSKALASDTNFANASLELRYIHGLNKPFAENDRLLLRGGVGALYTDNFDKLPPDLRFFAGGDRSLRGYRYQALGPRNAAGRVRGGRFLAIASVEYEHAINESYAVAAFADVGNAFDTQANEIKQGVGFGLRWRSPVGVVRLDTAFALDEPGKPARLHLVIGPDL